MPLLKQKFGYKTYRAVLKMLMAHLFAAVIFALVTVVVFIIFTGDEDGYVPEAINFIPMAIALAVLAFRLFKISRELGDESRMLARVGRTGKKKSFGLVLGLLAASPMLLCWLLVMLVYALRGGTNIFADLLSYLLYIWSPYFSRMSWVVDASKFTSNLIYLPPLLFILPFTYLGFSTGMKGRVEPAFSPRGKAVAATDRDNYVA